MIEQSVARHAAHVELISTGRAGLYLSAESGAPDDETICGTDGWALVRADGMIQWLAEDCADGTFRSLAVDPTTGAYVLPDDEES